jgi:hypothetical protein
MSLKRRLLKFVDLQLLDSTTPRPHPEEVPPTLPMKRLLRPLGFALLLLSPGINGSAWAGPGAFAKTLALQGVSFQVQATGEGSQQQLTITPRGAKRQFKPIRQTVDGRVVGAEVADLNSNSLPEIYVVVQSAGSGSYGKLVAYSVINSDQLSPIYLQELSGASANGYQGHDAFSVVEGCLVRRFPIYKPGDSKTKATGGLRQICYKLRNGEASWILRPTSVLQF